MRILVLNWRDIRSPEAGGSESHLHEILTRLLRRGHLATLLCSQFASRPGPSEETVDGVRTIRVGSWWNAHLTIPKAARRLLEAEPFDLVVDVINKIPFFAPTWSAVPVLAVVHHLLGRSVFLETNPVFASAIWLYERQVGQAYRDTPTIAISRSTRADLVARGLSGDRITIIEPGLDRSVHRPGVVQRHPVPLVVAVSRLKQYKRIDVAIRALAEVRRRVPAAELVVVGSGDRRQDLERLSRDLEVPVTFTGFISEAEKVGWLNRAQVVVCPSMKEGWGLTVIEALACGTPVVASDVHGHRDSLCEGAGVLVPYGDVGATAEAIVDILKDDRKREAFRRRGIAWASRFDWDTVADRFEAKMLEVAGVKAEGVAVS